MTIIRIHLPENKCVSFLKSQPVDNLVMDTQRFFRQIKRFNDPPDAIPHERLLSYISDELHKLKARYNGLEQLAKAIGGDTLVVFNSYLNYVTKHLNNIN